MRTQVESNSSRGTTTEQLVPVTDATLQRSTIACASVVLVDADS